MPEVDLSALVPGFYEPPYPADNPNTEKAEEAVIAWMWSIGFLKNSTQEDQLRSFRFGLYHGIATPHLELDGLVLGLKWFCWGSLADDQYDNFDWGERESRMQAVIQDARTILAGTPVANLAKNPVVLGLSEFWPDLTAKMSDEARARITRNYLDYLEAVMVQNRYHASQSIPDTATFLELRRHTIAMIFQADILETLSDLHIPELLREHRTFRELVRCFADITAWHNDIYGLDKDIRDEQTCNIVRVVATNEHCTLEEAVERVVDRAKERQRLLLTIESELPDLAHRLGLLPRDAVEAAILSKQLRAYTFANLVWEQKTRRYDLDRPRIRGTFDDVLTNHQVPGGKDG